MIQGRFSLNRLFRSYRPVVSRRSKYHEDVWDLSTMVWEAGRRDTFSVSFSKRVGYKWHCSQSILCEGYFLNTFGKCLIESWLEMSETYVQVVQYQYQWWNVITDKYGNIRYISINLILFISDLDVTKDTPIIMVGRDEFPQFWLHSSTWS